jgi:hypothetical protein
MADGTAHIRTDGALPACSPHGEVRLAGEELLGLATGAVAEVGIMNVTDVEAKALLVEAERARVRVQTALREHKRVRAAGDDDVQRLARVRERELRKW